MCSVVLSYALKLQFSAQGLWTVYSIYLWIGMSKRLSLVGFIQALARTWLLLQTVLANFLD